MAVIRKNQNEQYTGGTPYSGVQGVSQNTAQQIGKYQQGYQPSDTAVEAQNRLQQIQDQKPQGYNSKYGAQLEEIARQIENPSDFKFSFDGSELFKTYADMYNRDAKKAQINTMTNAAAMTGGYGNSYAAQVGQQAYDEKMNDLYGIGLDIYDREYQADKDKRADLYNRLAALQGLDESDYGRHRDTVSDWEKEREYQTGRADTERNFDYNTYLDALGYWTDAGAAENADYWTGQEFAEKQRQYDTTLEENIREFDLTHGENIRQFNETLAENIRQYDASLAENIRQFNESLDWDKLSTEQKYAMANVATMLELGVTPSLETLLKAGFSQADAEAIMALFAPAPAAGGGGGIGGGTTPVDIASEFGKYAGWQFGEGAKSLGQTIAEAAKKVGTESKDTGAKITKSSTVYKDYVNGDQKKKTNKPKTDTTGMGR